MNNRKSTMRKPRRVTVLGLNYAPEPSGSAPYTSGLAEGLAERGYEVTALVGYPYYPQWRVSPGYGGWRHREELNGVDVRRFRHPVPKSPTAAPRAVMETVFGLRQLTAHWPTTDVVVCASPALLSTAVASFRLRYGVRRPPFGIWIQDLYSLGVAETGTLGGRGARMATRLERSVLASADGLAVIHENFADYVTSRLSIPSDRVSVIRNWTHIVPTSLSNRAAVRRSYGWRDDEFIVLHAGNIGVKQGLENVVEAAQVAQSRASRVRFVLLGDGNQRPALEAQARGIDSISFIDPLPNGRFEEALAAADVLLVNEKVGVGQMSVPSKLTSYFAAERPVLASVDSTSITAKEILDAGAGLVVSSGNPAALVDAAERLSDNIALADEFGHAGLAFTREKLSRDSSLDAFELWLEQLVLARSTNERTRQR